MYCYVNKASGKKNCTTLMLICHCFRKYLQNELSQTKIIFCFVCHREIRLLLSTPQVRLPNVSVGSVMLYVSETTQYFINAHITVHSVLCLVCMNFFIYCIYFLTSRSLMMFLCECICSNITGMKLLFGGRMSKSFPPC